MLRYQGFGIGGIMEKQNVLIKGFLDAQWCGLALPT